MFLPVKPTSEPEFFCLPKVAGFCGGVYVRQHQRRVVFEMGLQVAVPDDGHRGIVDQGSPVRACLRERLEASPGAWLWCCACTIGRLNDRWLVSATLGRLAATIDD